MTPLDFRGLTLELPACSELAAKGGFSHPLTSIANTRCGSPGGEMTLLDYFTEHARRHRRAAFQPPLGAFRDRSPDHHGDDHQGIPTAY